MTKPLTHALQRATQATEQHPVWTMYVFAAGTLLGFIIGHAS